VQTNCIDTSVAVFFLSAPLLSIQPPPCATGPNKQPPNYSGAPALPLYNATTNCSGQVTGDCNAQIVQQPVVENDLSSNYGNFASDFIREHGSPGSKPFFLYMAFSHTHVSWAERK
jgi:hypothetical protein